MTDRQKALTPDALLMMDAIARSGSFASAARELGKVPSALTYSVRQLEEQLDVLLFDRKSRQARLTAAGEELLHEGRRLLQQMDAVANRVRRVASGWEAELTIAFDSILSSQVQLDLLEAFYAQRPFGDAGGPPSTRVRCRHEVLSGTWQALLSGQADLAVGVAREISHVAGIETRKLGEMNFVFAVAPHHPLASETCAISDEQLLRHRAVAVADSATQGHPVTVNLLAGQDVLTVASTAAKLAAQIRGLGCGFLPEPLARPHVEAGRLVLKETQRPPQKAELHFAWRRLPRGARGQMGQALKWWIEQLSHGHTQASLLDDHSEPY